MFLCLKLQTVTSLEARHSSDKAFTVAGTIFGMANTLSSLGGFLSSLMVGMLTQDNVSIARYILLVPSQVTLPTLHLA